MVPGDGGRGPFWEMKQPRMSKSGAVSECIMKGAVLVRLYLNHLKIEANPLTMLDTTFLTTVATAFTT